jgi:hypothetical protein
MVLTFTPGSQGRVVLGIVLMGLAVVLLGRTLYGGRNQRGAVAVPW